MKNTDINDENKAKISNPITVRCRVIFLKIEDVNTRNENFTAEVFIECSWVDEKIIKTLTSRNGKFKLLFFNYSCLNSNLT